MGDFIEGLREDKKKLLLVVVGLLAVVGIAIGGFMAVGGGDGEPEPSDEVVFEFEEEEPEMSVEEQVRLTVEASVPTPTVTPTPDVPATLAAKEAEFQATREADKALQVSDVPSGTSMEITRLDSRYLDGLGRPMWLTVRSHLRMSAMFEDLPSRVLTAENQSELERVGGDMRRAESYLEELGFQPRSLSPAVREYGRYVEDLVRLTRDSHREAALMFSKVDLEQETYDAMSNVTRDELEQIYYRIGENLNRFDRDMQRYGCSACGELFRGRAEGGF